MFMLFWFLSSTRTPLPVWHNLPRPTCTFLNCAFISCVYTGCMMIVWIHSVNDPLCLREDTALYSCYFITQNEEREDMSTGRTIKGSGRNATFPFHFQWGPLHPETAEVEAISTFGPTSHNGSCYINRTPTSPHQPYDTSTPPPWRQISGYVPKSLHHCQPKGGTAITSLAVVLSLRPGR